MGDVSPEDRLEVEGVLFDSGSQDVSGQNCSCLFLNLLFEFSKELLFDAKRVRNC